MSIPRSEYPRPRFVRNEWQCLNGEWDFAFDFGNSGEYREFWKKDCDVFDKKIIVPFVPESELSGIGYTDFFTTCWYRRKISIPKNWDLAKGRVLLHVGAADFICKAWVNEKPAGTHKGGYTPFDFDITPYISEGENDLVIRIYDNGRDPSQYTGKQIYFNYYNKSCYYTRCTGIWQTVWLEYVPALYIKNAFLTPDVDNEKLNIRVELNDWAPKGTSVSALATFCHESVNSASAIITGRTASFSLDIKNPKLWDCENPNLYDLVLKCGDDTVRTYFGMRKIAVNGYAIELNDKPVYQRLVLDQGYYPDGIITAPDIETIERDTLLTKEAGFNGARLHMKVFDPYKTYYADKLGLLLWGEFPNWGLNVNEPSAATHMIPGWLEAVERDYSAPSIVGWCPLNETSDRRCPEFFKLIYDTTRLIDPYRPVIDTSGYTHVVTDIYDVHDYDQDPVAMRERYVSLEKGEGKVFVNIDRVEKYEGQPYFVSEYGGIFWDITETKGDDWGYGEAPKELEELYARLEGLTDVLLENPKMCAFCYTQLTDVYQEKNGIYSFDRRKKFDPARLKAIFGKKAAIEK